MVFISDAVTLWAYKVGCNVGGGVCTPVWSAAINPLSMGYASTPAVSGGVVYMSGAQKLYAFDEKCGSGGATCTPLWTAAIVEGQTPAVGNGAVFVTGSERLGSTRLVMAVQTGCRSDGGRCSILWKGGAGEDVNTAPAVANGLVFAGGAHGKVVAFGAACGTGGAACQPLWSAATMDWPMENSPAIANGTLYMAAENRAVYAFTLASAGNVTPPPTNSGSSETTRNGGELPIAALLALAALFGTTVAFVRTQQPARP
jgi:outer membrane protein assembly factor BamB